MLVSAAWLGPATLAGLNVYLQQRFGGEPVVLSEVVFVSCDWFLYAFLTPGVFALARRFPLARPHLLRNVIVQAALSIVFCALWAAGGTALRAVLMPRTLWGG